MIDPTPEERKLLMEFAKEEIRQMTLRDDSPVIATLREQLEAVTNLHNTYINTIVELLGYEMAVKIADAVQTKLELEDDND